MADDNTPSDNVDDDVPSSSPSPQPDNDVFDLNLETHKEITTQDSSTDSSNTIDDASKTSSSSVAMLEYDKPKSPDITGTPIVVDATNHIAGRLSSLVAKLLLQGNRVSLVNCERIMISGTRANTIYEYRQFLKINSIINPKHGPVHYRRPDTVITKMIRGMLPFEKKPSGKTAHKRLRAYVGSPKELKSFKKVQFEKAKIRRTASSYTTMGELCRVIGWTE